MGLLENAILDGRYDDKLESLYEAIRDRQKELRRREAIAVANSVDAGARVTIGDHISPKYLTGVGATVVKTPRYGAKSVEVRIDDVLEARSYADNVCKIPAACLTIEAIE